MRKLTCWLLLTAVFFGVQATTALAIPAFKAAFIEFYNCGEEPATDTEKALADKVAVAKCNICHVDGEKKSVNNPYGLALDELLDKANFSSTRRKEDPDAVKKEIEDALKKIEAAEASDDETFGDRVKAGNLPCPE